MAFFVFIILGPLVMFTSPMAAAKRKGLADYGLLAQRYVEGFADKWVEGYSDVWGDLLGMAIASLSPILTTAMEWCEKCVPCPSG